MGRRPYQSDLIEVMEITLMKGLRMKSFNATLFFFTLMFMLSHFSFAYTDFGPIRKGSSCWFCKTTDPDNNWFAEDYNKKRALQKSFVACQKETGRSVEQCKPQKESCKTYAYSTGWGQCNQVFRISRKPKSSPPRNISPAPRCSKDSGCSLGEKCSHGNCVSDESCFSSSDCRGSFEKCLDGLCVADDRCNSSIDCSGLEICVDHKCTNKNSSDNRCSLNSDCDFPRRCLGGKCADSFDGRCNSDLDCHFGKKCSFGKCE